jgi:hypothetical protein
MGQKSRQVGKAWREESGLNQAVRNQGVAVTVQSSVVIVTAVALVAVLR